MSDKIRVGIVGFGTVGTGALGYRAMALAGDYVYLAGRVPHNPLRVVDVGDPRNPTVVPAPEIPLVSAFAIGVVGSAAYVLGHEEYVRVTIENPWDPWDPYYEWRLRNLRLVAIDLANPHEPSAIGFAPLAPAVDTGVWPFSDIDVAGGRVIVASDRLYSVPVQCGTYPLPRQVAIDVMPGNDRNPINCKGNPGIIPVAILTTDSFDALTVDHATVRFGTGGASEAHVIRAPTPATNGGFHPHVRSDIPRRHEKDVDHDGDLDLLFHFARDEAGIRCGDTEVGLTGMTYDGLPVTGTDEIRTVPGGDTETEAEWEFQIAPNPFNPSTSVSFVVREPQHVKIGVYDVRGRLVAALANEPYPTGRHTVAWQGRDRDGRTMPSGTYFFRVEQGDRIEVRKALLLK